MNTQHSRQRPYGQQDWQGRDARDRGDERQGQWQRSDQNVEGVHGPDRNRDHDSGYHDSGHDDRGSFHRRAMGTQGGPEEGRYMPGGRDFGGARYGESRGSRHDSDQERSYGRGHDVGYRGYAEDGPGHGEFGAGFRGDYDREYSRNQNANSYDPRRMQPRSEWIGKGPKGYVRSPERIGEQVSELLSQGYLDASDIEVSVSGNTVTLSGTVADRQTKRLAEQLAESCSWVGDVENQLRIRGRANVSSRDQSETGSSAASSKRASA